MGMRGSLRTPRHRPENGERATAGEYHHAIAVEYRRPISSGSSTAGEVYSAKFMVFGVGTADLDAEGMGRAAGVEDGSRQAEDQEQRTKAHLSAFAITLHTCSPTASENHPWKCESTWKWTKTLVPNA